MIKGLAFHWYSGDHFQALRLVKEHFPNKKLILSEACIEYCKYGVYDFLANAQKYAHDIIGNINEGMEAFYDWNILLDKMGGPNHVNNYCDAPFMYDVEKKELMERNTLNYLMHFAKFIKPGAKRIANTTYHEAIEMCSFQNISGEIICVFLNRSKNDMEINIRLQGKLVHFNLKAESINSAIIL